MIEYHCPHCNEAKTKDEVIKVPKDINGLPSFTSCRTCNRRVEIKYGNSLS